MVIMQLYMLISINFRIKSLGFLEILNASKSLIKGLISSSDNRLMINGFCSRSVVKQSKGIFKAGPNLLLLLSYLLAIKAII